MTARNRLEALVEPDYVRNHVASPQVDDLDDGEVIAGSLQDPEQFAVVFRRHAPGISVTPAARLGASAAEDVVAETFLTAFRQRATYQRGRPTRGRGCTGSPPTSSGATVRPRPGSTEQAWGGAPPHAGTGQSCPGRSGALRRGHDRLR